VATLASACLAVGGSAARNGWVDRLVPLSSALGQHADPERSLGFVIQPGNGSRLKPHRLDAQPGVRPVVALAVMRGAVVQPDVPCAAF
jgi:hypothetical protein